MLADDNEEEMNLPRATLWSRALHPAEPLRQASLRLTHKMKKTAAGVLDRRHKGFGEAQSRCSFREYIHADTHETMRCVG